MTQTAFRLLAPGDIVHITNDPPHYNYRIGPRHFTRQRLADTTMNVAAMEMPITNLATGRSAGVVRTTDHHWNLVDQIMEFNESGQTGIPC